MNKWEWRKACASLPKVPFVFICLISGSEKTINNYKENHKKIGEDDSELIGICFSPLGELISFEKDTTNEIFNFINSGFGELSKLVDKIVVTE